MRRNGVWLLCLAVTAAAGLCAALLLPGSALDLAEGDFRADEAAVAGPGAADAAGLSALSSERQARDRARAEAAAKAAAAPTFTKAEGVFGRVLDKRGGPVSGARLSLFVLDPAAPWGAPEGTPAATAVAGADGAYLIGPAPERQRLKLKAQATGYSTAVVFVQTRGACQDVELDRGGAVRVTVKDETGKAVAGAEVVFPATSTVAATGADGTALLESLAPGQAALRVQMRGFASAHIHDVVVEPGKTVERATVLVRGTTIEGQVVDPSGAPVADAAVSVKPQWDASVEAAAPATSDPDGRFSTVASGGSGEWLQVVATKEGFAPGVTGVMLQQGGQPTNVLVKLAAEASVVGRVEDRDGRPVAGATVVYGRQHRYPASPRVNLTATTGEDGAFALPLPQALPQQEGQALFLAARAPGKGAGGASTKPPKAGEPPPPPVVIQLQGAGAVEGTVEDAAGRPVEGATVTLSIDGNQQSVQLASGAVKNVDWSTRMAVQDPRLTRLATSTDAAGTFRIEDVPAGTYNATVAFGLDTEGGSEPVTVRGDAVEKVKLTTGTGATIEGVVRDGADAPVAGASVNAHDPVQRGQGQSWRAAQTRTDSDGRFVLRGVRGDSTWQLTVSATGYKSPEARPVRPGEKGVELRLTVLGWIEGVVLVDGAPYGRPFTVSAQAQQQGNRSQGEAVEFVMGPGGQSWRQGGGASGQFGSADGTFLLKNLAAGSYVLNVTTRDGLIPVVTPPVSVSDGRASGPVSIALERGATLAGVVMDEATRQPLSQAWVNVNVRGQAQSGGATAGHAQTDAKGRFAAQGLASGTYTVQVTPPNAVAFDDEVALERGRTEERIFLAPRAGAVLVRVVDGEGKPVADAQVHFLTERGNYVQPNWEAIRREGRIDLNRPDAWQRLTQTDATGTMLRTMLPAGRLQVQVHAQNVKPPAPIWVAVAGDETVDAVVTVDRTGGEAAAK